MIRNIFTLLALHGLLVIAASAQSVSYKTYDYQPVSRAAVVNFAELGPDFAPEMEYLEAPGPGGPSYKQYLRQQKKESAMRFPRKGETAGTRGLATPPVLVNDFIGNTSSGSTPMDNHLAVSNGNQIVSVINRHIAIKDPFGDWIGAATLDNFFITMGLNINKFDPRILYDPEHDKFVLFAIGGNSSFESWVLLGFSQTNDADGAWNLYKIDGNPFSNGSWADYPIVALSSQEVFVTCNSVLDSQPWQTGFYESLIFQIDKMKGYSGEPLLVKLWSEIEFEGKRIRNLCPVKSADGTTEDRIFLLSNRNFAVQNDSIFILELDGVQTDPEVSLSIDVRKSDKAYGLSPDAVQPSGLLATNDARVLDAFRLGEQIQFVGNSIDTTTGQAAIYHGIIDNLGTTRDVTGNVVTGGADDLGYPSIAYAGIQPDDEDAIIIVSHASSVRFPGCSALYFDNERQHSELVTIKEGLDFINMINNEPLERWGDYSGNQRKFDQPGIVWGSSSYGKSNNDNDTWIASLASPLYFSSAKEHQPEQLQVDVFPVPASDRVTIEFEARGIQRVRISLMDMEGRLVRTLMEDRPKQEGKAQFSFATAPLPQGTYVLTVQGDGKALASKKIVVSR